MSEIDAPVCVKDGKFMALKIAQIGMYSNLYSFQCESCGRVSTLTGG